MRGKKTNALLRYVHNNRFFLLFGAVMLLLGVCIGAGVGAFMPAEAAVGVQDFLHQIITAGQAAIEPGQAFRSAMSTALWFGLFFWFCGLTRMGLFLAPGGLLVKAFGCGFTVASLIRFYRGQGLAAAALGVLPQMMIILPCLLVFAVSAMNQSKSAMEPEKPKPNKRLFAYSLFCMMLFCILFGCVCLEAYISPYLFFWVFQQ